jgi:hypothetical protein
VKAGAEPTRSFKISNSQKNTTLIGTVGSPMGPGAAQFMITGTLDFSLTKGRAPDVIMVQYIPSAPGATDTATITITSSDPRHPMVVVKLKGKGKKQ